MRFQRAMSPCCLDEPRSSTPLRRMELVGAPLGEDLLGSLGEHCVGRASIYASTPERAPARWLGPAHSRRGGWQR
jgi:hypothetical protein